jgi:hypothetical protein
VLFNIRVNVWTWARDSEHPRAHLWNLGAEARKVIDNNQHLITDDGPYPHKLLFIGRSGTAAGSGVYEACNQPQYSGRQLAIVSDSPPPSTALCGGRPLDTKTVETSSAKWYVSLVR